MTNQDSRNRAEIIRQGNAAFNAKDYKKARDCFFQAGYKDGIIRLGDHYMYDRKLPLLAYGYYRRAGAADKVQDIHRRMVGALSVWLGQDKIKPDSLAQSSKEFSNVKAGADGMITLPISNELRQTALAILNRK